jgi:phosphotriesterase-related protein
MKSWKDFKISYYLFFEEMHWMIQTVCGNIPKEKLGVTMSHEHLLLDLRAVRHDNASVLNDLQMISGELNKAADYGCQSIVEVTTADMGRNPNGLRKLSQITGINIIEATGFYLKDYHTDWLKAASDQEVEDFFVKEITQGIDDTDIKAGIIGEVASSEKIYPSEKKVLIAAARASKRTNAAVTTHCDRGLLGLEQIDLMLKEGMDADKLILGHTDLTADADYQMKLLDSGVNIAFDTIGKNNYLSDDIRARTIIRLLEAGWEDHLLLSEDVSKQSYLTKLGGRGYVAVLGYFVPGLRKMGVTEDQLHRMLVDNPARILDR